MSERLPHENDPSHEYSFSEVEKNLRVMQAGDSIVAMEDEAQLNRAVYSLARASLYGMYDYSYPPTSQLPMLDFGIDSVTNRVVGSSFFRGKFPADHLRPSRFYGKLTNLSLILLSDLPNSGYVGSFIEGEFKAQLSADLSSSGRGVIASSTKLLTIVRDSMYNSSGRLADIRTTRYEDIGANAQNLINASAITAKAREASARLHPTSAGLPSLGKNR